MPCIPTEVLALAVRRLDVGPGQQAQVDQRADAADQHGQDQDPARRLAERAAQRVWPTRMPEAEADRAERRDDLELDALERDPRIGGHGGSLDGADGPDCEATPRH